ncbi:hypothetical protein D3C81_760840 [compost metagenome]
MKKRPKSTKVHYLNQKLLKSRSTETNNTINKDNVIELMTCCEICDTITTKKNFINGMYMCEECAELSASEIYNKVASTIENNIKNEMQTYINWDEEDLDYLYYTFWCDNNDNSPNNN